LGLEPMSQYDASATPLYHAFQQQAVLTPFQHLEPRISIEEFNQPSAYGAKESMKLDLSDPDEIPMALMNEILWKSIKGKDSIMPPPIHSSASGSLALNQR